MSIRARFYVSKFEKQVVGHKDADRKEPVLQAQVTLNAVTRKDTRDNIDWAKFTPVGQMTLSVSQAAGGAFEAFESLLGRDVSVLIDGIPEGE